MLAVLVIAFTMHISQKRECRSLGIVPELLKKSPYRTVEYSYSSFIVLQYVLYFDDFTTEELPLPPVIVAQGHWMPQVEACEAPHYYCTILQPACTRRFKHPVFMRLVIRTAFKEDSAEEQK